MHGGCSQLQVLNAESVFKYVLYHSACVSAGAVSLRVLRLVQQQRHQLVLEHMVHCQNVKLIQVNLSETRNKGMHLKCHETIH